MCKKKLAKRKKEFSLHGFITARKRSLPQGNIFAPVCHSVHRGEYLTPPRPGAPPDQVPPVTRYTPGAGTSPGPGTTPPGTRSTPQDQVHPPRTRYTLPVQVHPPRTRYTPRDKVHSPGTRYTPSVQSMLGDTVNTRAVRILLECNLVLLFQ